MTILEQIIDEQFTASDAPTAPGDDVQAYTLMRFGYLAAAAYPEITLNAGDVHQALRTAIVYLTRNGWTVRDAEIDPEFKDAADLAASRGAELATFALDRRA